MGFLELIDTCWDVNISAQLQNFVRQMELIDTCWDVNISAQLQNFVRQMELIDTCWDVNKFLKKKQVFQSLN